MTTVEIIPVDSNTRIRVEYDEKGESPMSWGDHVTEDGPEMDAWRAGEVYGVIVERLVTWVRPDTGAEREEWEETDSVWGCYLDETYTALVCATENFNLTGM